MSYCSMPASWSSTQQQQQQQHQEEEANCRAQPSCTALSSQLGEEDNSASRSPEIPTGPPGTHTQSMRSTERAYLEPTL